MNRSPLSLLHHRRLVEYVVGWVGGVRCVMIGSYRSLWLPRQSSAGHWQRCRRSAWGLALSRARIAGPIEYVKKKSQQSVW